MLHVGHEKTHPGHVDLSNLMAEIFFVCDISKSSCKMVETGPIFVQSFSTFGYGILKNGVFVNPDEVRFDHDDVPSFFSMEIDLLVGRLETGCQRNSRVKLHSCNNHQPANLAGRKVGITPTQIGSGNGSDSRIVFQVPSIFQGDFSTNPVKKTTSRV